MFKQAGDFEGKILEAMTTKYKYKPNPNQHPDAFYVRIEVEGPEYGGMPQTGTWFGYHSPEIMTGKNNYSGKVWADVTMSNLERIGWEHGKELWKLDTLVGKTIPFTVVAEEWEGQVRFTVKFIGSSNYKPEKMDVDELKRCIAATAKSTVAAAPASTDDWL